MLATVPLSGPARLERAGRVVLPEGILDIAVAGDPSAGRVYAYLALGQGGLGVVDVSDPAHPSVVGIQSMSGHTRAVAVASGGDGDAAYLYVSAGALHVLDISAGADSDPTNPDEIAVYRPADVMGNVGQVLSVSAGLAYVLYHGGSGRTGSLRILDVSEPAVPVEAGSYRIGVPIRDGAVAGDHAYLLVGKGIPYLVVLDLSDPSQPAVASPEGDKTWLGQSLGLLGQTLYLASPAASDKAGSVQVLDLADPVHPVALGRYEGASAPVTEIAAVGSQVVLAAGDSVVLVDVSSPATPATAGRYDMQRLPGVRRGLAVSGDYAYVAAGGDGLWVVDVSDPADPRVVSNLDTWGHARDVALWEGYAYVADEQGGLRVIDVWEPARPVEVGAFETPGASLFFSDVEIGAQPSLGRAFAYVADALPGDTSLRILDLADPKSPVQVGRLPLGEGLQGDVRAYGVAVAGEYAYLGVGAAGLRVVDVSDPSSPVEVGALDVPGRADNLVVAGERVYLTDGDLRIVDVSNPASPREVGFYDVPSLSPWPYAATDGRYVYLTALGTRVLDAAGPGAPLETAYHPLGHGAVALDGGRVYVLGDGLLILRPRESAEATRWPTPTPISECTDYDAAMGLWTEDTRPYVGDVVTVTAALINEGCGTLGMPKYTLYLDTKETLSPFEAVPEPVVRLIGIAPGQSDAVEFILGAARPGQATLTAGVSFEFHGGQPGPGYWGSASTGPLQIAVRAPEPEPVLKGGLPVDLGPGEQ
jgi:hypothetical protein